MSIMKQITPEELEVGDSIFLRGFEAPDLDRQPLKVLEIRSCYYDPPECGFGRSRDIALACCRKIITTLDDAGNFVGGKCLCPDRQIYPVNIKKRHCKINKVTEI